MKSPGYVVAVLVAAALYASAQPVSETINNDGAVVTQTKDVVANSQEQESNVEADSQLAQVHQIRKRDIKTEAETTVQGTVSLNSPTSVFKIPLLNPLLNARSHILSTAAGISKAFDVKKYIGAIEKTVGDVAHGVIQTPVKIIETALNDFSSAKPGVKGLSILKLSDFLKSNLNVVKPLPHGGPLIQLLLDILSRISKFDDSKLTNGLDALEEKLANAAHNVVQNPILSAAIHSWCTAVKIDETIIFKHIEDIEETFISVAHQVFQNSLFNRILRAWCIVTGSDELSLLGHMDALGEKFIKAINDAAKFPLLNGAFNTLTAISEFDDAVVSDIVNGIEEKLAFLTHNLVQSPLLTTVVHTWCTAAKIDETIIPKYIEDIEHKFIYAVHEVIQNNIINKSVRFWCIVTGSHGTILLSYMDTLGEILIKGVNDAVNNPLMETLLNTLSGIAAYDEEAIWKNIGGLIQKKIGIIQNLFKNNVFNVAFDTLPAILSDEVAAAKYVGDVEEKLINSLHNVIGNTHKNIELVLQSLSIATEDDILSVAKFIDFMEEKLVDVVHGAVQNSIIKTIICALSAVTETDGSFLSSFVYFIEKIKDDIIKWLSLYTIDHQSISLVNPLWSPDIVKKILEPIGKIGTSVPAIIEHKFKENSFTLPLIHDFADKVPLDKAETHNQIKEEPIADHSINIQEIKNQPAIEHTYVEKSSKPLNDYKIQNDPYIPSRTSDESTYSELIDEPISDEHTWDEESQEYDRTYEEELDQNLMDYIRKVDKKLDKLSADYGSANKQPAHDSHISNQIIRNERSLNQPLDNTPIQNQPGMIQSSVNQEVYNELIENQVHRELAPNRQIYNEPVQSQPAVQPPVNQEVYSEIIENQVNRQLAPNPQVNNKPVQSQPAVIQPPVNQMVYSEIIENQVNRQLAPNPQVNNEPVQSQPAVIQPPVNQEFYSEIIENHVNRKPASHQQVYNDVNDEHIVIPSNPNEQLYNEPDNRRIIIRPSPDQQVIIQEGPDQPAHVQRVVVPTHSEQQPSPPFNQQGPNYNALQPRNNRRNPNQHIYNEMPQNQQDFAESQQLHNQRFLNQRNPNRLNRDRRGHGQPGQDDGPSAYSAQHQQVYNQPSRRQPAYKRVRHSDSEAYANAVAGEGGTGASASAMAG